MNLYIGTAGWSYPDWKGVVYPEKGKTDQLAFIARYFNAVEIDNTFYRPPEPRVTASWVRRTADRPDFHFTLKLWQHFTHERETPYTQADVDTIRKGIEPLAVSGRLGGILIQFPWSFRNADDSRDLVGRLSRDFADYRKWIEVRHRSWDTSDSFQFFRSVGLGFANIDQPVTRTSIPPTAVLTSDAAYVRLHGRNYKAWFAKDAGRDERYNYFYPDEELDEWVGKIQKLVTEARTVYVIANNHYRGQAPANALQLSSKLSGKTVDVPPDLLQTYPVLRKIASAAPEADTLF